MRKVRFYLDTPYEGCGYEELFLDYADDVSDDKIDEDFDFWLRDKTNSFWEDMEEEEWEKEKAYWAESCLAR